MSWKEVKDKILKLLAEQDKPRTMRFIANRLGGGSNVRDPLRQLELEGKVHRSRSGNRDLYELTEELYIE